jgi:hypothetical protein
VIAYFNFNLFLCSSDPKGGLWPTGYRTCQLVYIVVCTK